MYINFVKSDETFPAPALANFTLNSALYSAIAFTVAKVSGYVLRTLGIAAINPSTVLAVFRTVGFVCGSAALVGALASLALLAVIGVAKIVFVAG
jgi:hypothetical protein